MRLIASAAILVGIALCISGLVVIPLATDGFQFHQADLISGAWLNVFPIWGVEETATLAEPQNVTVRITDQPSHNGLPCHLVNLTPLSLPATVLGDMLYGWFHVNVTGDPVNFYFINDENLTKWLGGEWFSSIFSWGYVQGDRYFGLTARRPDMGSLTYLVLERSSSGTTDVPVFLAGSLAWTPRTDNPDHAFASIPSPAMAESSQDVRLEGNATERSGVPFEFLVFDAPDWGQWSLGRPATPLFEVSGNSTYRFVAPLTNPVPQGTTLYFVARYTGTGSLRVSVNATVRIAWWEPPFAAARPFIMTLGGVLGFSGVAVAAGGVLLEIGPASPRKRGT
jgi:hypothetical protein